MAFFTNRNGLQLSYTLTIKNPADRKIYIICQISMVEVFFSYEILSNCLQINTFRFYFTGNENSEGSYSLGEFVRDAGDINDAVNFLTSQGYQVEGLIGNCKGGNNVIIYSALYGKVKNIVALSPRFHMNSMPSFFKEWHEAIQKNGEFVHSAFGREVRWTKEMFDEVMNLDMKSYCERAQGDIYIIHGNEDELVSYSEMVEFERQLKDKCKGIFTLNCDHFFTAGLDEVAEVIQEIFNEA